MNVLGHFIQYIVDVDHNITTIDGHNTFHVLRGGREDEAGTGDQEAGGGDAGVGS